MQVKIIRLEYINNKWYIIDGTEKKPSSNGTWLFLENLNPIFEGMIVRAGLSVFKFTNLNVDT